MRKVISKKLIYRFSVQVIVNEKLNEKRKDELALAIVDALQPFRICFYMESGSRDLVDVTFVKEQVDISQMQ